MAFRHFNWCPLLLVLSWALLRRAWLCLHFCPIRYLFCSLIRLFSQPSFPQHKKSQLLLIGEMLQSMFVVFTDSLLYLHVLFVLKCPRLDPAPHMWLTSDEQRRIPTQAILWFYDSMIWKIGAPWVRTSTASKSWLAEYESQLQMAEKPGFINQSLYLPDANTEAYIYLISVYPRMCITTPTPAITVVGYLRSLCALIP